MSGTFTRGIDHLLSQVPRHTKMGVTVDQVYAHYQHEHPEFHHPDGGGAFYLRDPVFGKARKYLGDVAHGVIGPKGITIRAAMVAAAEDLSMEVYLRAPWEFGDLRASGHPWVEEDGIRVYDRKPNCERLAPEELAIKSHLRYLFDPHRYDGRA
jgi:hypothetical protein